MDQPNVRSTEERPLLNSAGLVLASPNGSELARLPAEAQLSTMRHMMEALFARVNAMQQNQAAQFSGVNDRLDAVELEIPLIQEQSALRIRDLESRMSGEIEEAAAGIHEEVAGKLGSLTSLFESQRSELVQLRDSKRDTEDRLSRAILDVERLCGNLGPGTVEAVVESPASPSRSRIAKHIRKAAVDAAAVDNTPLVEDPSLKKLMTDQTPLEIVVAAPASAPVRRLAAADAGVRKAAMQATAVGWQTVPGFDDWKRQFMQDGEPLQPTMTPDSGKPNRLVICPRCYSERTRPATLTRIDAILRLTGYSPHRCRSCAHRFYKRGVMTVHSADEECMEGRSEEIMETR